MLCSYKPGNKSQGTNVSFYMFSSWNQLGSKFNFISIKKTYKIQNVNKQTTKLMEELSERPEKPVESPSLKLKEKRYDQ